MLVGRPGSGKSTFALKLHHSTGIPLYHLDKYFYVKDWVERDESDFLKIQRELVGKDEWIIDGNCLKSLGMRVQRATHVIYFNYPRFTCIWRIIKRRFLKSDDIQDRAEGCRERLSWKLLAYSWDFEDRIKAASLNGLINSSPRIIFFEVRNSKMLKLAWKTLCK